MSAAATAPARAYATVTGDAKRDRERIVGIWRGNLGQEALLAAKYDWFYLGCPWGEPLVELLRHEPSSAFVGVAAAGPRRMVWKGRELQAGVLVDLAVTTDHRSLGPALSLQKALLAAGRERFELLYGFPNPKAAPVFKRVGYQQLGEMVRYARVVRHRRHLAKRMPDVAARPLGFVLDAAQRVRGRLARRGADWTASWSEHVDPRMDELWASTDHGAGPLGVRDTMTLRWRFDRSPVAKTRYLLLAERGGQLRAWFACQADALGTLHVRDFWTVDGARGADRLAVETLLRAARRAGHATVSVEFAGPAARMAGWLGAGFVERSRRPVFGRFRDADADASRGELHLTAADEDE